MNDIVRELLTKRGLTDPEEIREFLDPHPRTAYDPRLLYGMQEAVSVILAAVQRGDKIVVYGDYDADGVTATVIMMTILRALGAKAPSFYIPSRFDEGYGLNEQAIVKLADLGVDMIITVDCGAVSYFEVETAKEYGIQVVVTDHHNCADGVADTIVLPINWRWRCGMLPDWIKRSPTIFSIWSRSARSPMWYRSPVKTAVLSNTASARSIPAAGSA